MIVAALVTFFSLMLLITHLSARWTRRLVGYKGIVDVVLHTTVIYLFFGTSTEGLLQAECAAIFVSLWLRAYRYCLGYERLVGTKWVRFSGIFTKGD